jgi:uncharacterized RDD family membrane protein YckC
VGFLEPTFGQRLTGRLIDGLISGFVGFAVGQVVDGLTFRLFGMVLFVVVEIGFLLAAGGQTLGKRAVGTRVTSMNGDPVEIRQAVVRSLVLGFSVLTPISLLVVLPVLKGPLHRGVHDWLAGTIVTAVPEPETEP